MPTPAIPNWYTEPSPSELGVTVPSFRRQPTPSWYTEPSASELAPVPQPANPAPTPPPVPLPSWYKPEPGTPATAPGAPQPAWNANTAPGASAANVTQSWDGVPAPGLPDWYSPEPEDTSKPASPFVPAVPPQDPSAARNFLTGLLRVPGAIIGTPHTIAHTVDWGQAQFDNGLNILFRRKERETGADVDKRSAIVGALPTPESVDNTVFNKTGVTPYQPQTWLGDIGQAATTAAGGGLIDPAADIGAMKQAPSVLRAFLQFVKGAGANATKNAIAGGAAQGTQEVLPDTPGLAAAAALLTHGGASATGAAGRASSGVVADAARQVLTPTRQGTREAGRVLAKVDNTAPGLAIPSAADLTDAQGNVRSATDDIGAGLEPWQAGSLLRSGLQQRVDSLEQARDTATAPLREARDTSPAIVNTQPVLDLIDKKLNVAAGAQQDALQGARDDLHLAAGTSREDAEQLAASRQAINARISDASRAGDNASAAHLLDVRKALDAQINSAVPEAGEYTRKYAEMSRPLDPASYGPVAKVLDRDQFNSRYTFPDERVPDLFLRSPATRSDLNQLVAAHGGDREAALGALQDHLAGVAQRAVQPDGTLDAGAFDKAMKPYQKSLGNVGVWFPELNQKFNTAKAAQGTLDKLNAQRGLADAVTGGALRDNTGAVTGASFNGWLRTNRDAISKTQSPGAMMRLQSMASALQNTRPGELADVLKSEWAPTVFGMATGGLEGGVLGTLLHKSTQAAFGGLDAKRQAAFSAAIEKATLDPAYAARLSANAAKRSGPGVSAVRGLVRAIAATPIAVNAADAN